MEQVRVLVVEDDDRDAEELAQALHRFFEEERVACEVSRMCDGAEFVERYRGGADIVFLDIEMPGLDGLSAARALRERDDGVLVFFVTRCAQYALEGYTVDATGYVLKPVAYGSLKEHLQRAMSRLARRRAPLIRLRSGRECVFVSADLIAYVETMHKRTLVHTVTGDIRCSEAMQAVERKLDERQFFRVHASFVVNLAYVDTVTPKDVVVRGVALPVSKHRKRFFMQALAEYKGRCL